MVNLSELIDEIRNDNEVSSLTANEQMEYTTFRYLAEVTNLEKIYPLIKTSGFFAEFVDDSKVRHFTRIVYQPLKIPRHDVKIGFYDESGKPSYERPNLHYNLHPDEKIFNTHLYILLKVFFENDDFFGKTGATELHLPAIDYARYRLFKMAISKFLDKSKYELVDDSLSKNSLLIKKKDLKKA
jgi:hypothetical protein